MHEELERDEFMLMGDDDDLEETTDLEEADLETEAEEEDDDFLDAPEEEKDR